MLIWLVLANAYLVGLATTVAVVVYPSFLLIGAGQWESFHIAHQRRIAWAVAPAWIVQIVLSLWWTARSSGVILAWLNLSFAIVAIVITVSGAMPIHRRLERHFDDHDVRLVRQWHVWRLIAWTACALLSAIAL